MANTPKPIRKSIKATESYARTSVKAGKARTAYEDKPSNKSAEASVTAAKNSASAAKNRIPKIAESNKSTSRAMNKAIKKGNSVSVVKTSEKAVKGTIREIKSLDSATKARGK